MDFVLQIAPVAELSRINEIPSVSTEKGVVFSLKHDTSVVSIDIVIVGFTVINLFCCRCLERRCFICLVLKRCLCLGMGFRFRFRVRFRVNEVVLETSKCDYR